MKMERKLFVVGCCILLISMGLSALATRTITDTSDSVNTMIVCSNGNTYTATAANLQTAIYSLNGTNGGRVILPAGTFALTTTLKITKPIILEGAGTGIGNNPNDRPVTMITYPNSTGYAILAYNASSIPIRGVQIRNMIINGQGYTNSWGGIHFRSVQHGIIENVYIRRFAGTNGTGINISGNSGYYNKISTFEIHYCRIGIVLRNNAQTIYDGQITGTDGSTITGAQIGIKIQSDTNWIGNVDIEAFSNTGSIGIYIGDTADGTQAGYNKFMGTRLEVVYDGVIMYSTGAGQNRFTACSFATITNKTSKQIGSLKARFRDCTGYDTENYGADSVANNATITHYMEETPTGVVCTCSVFGETCQVTQITSTTFKVSIRKHDGSVGTTQTIYWYAFYKY